MEVQENDMEVQDEAVLPVPPSIFTVTEETLE